MKKARYGQGEEWRRTVAPTSRLRSPCLQFRPKLCPTRRHLGKFCAPLARIPAMARAGFSSRNSRRRVAREFEDSTGSFCATIPIASRVGQCLMFYQLFTKGSRGSRRRTQYWPLETSRAEAAQNAETQEV